MGSFRAEMFVLRKRAATWILLAVAAATTIFFSYFLPYLSYLNAPAGEQSAAALQPMLPPQLVSTLLGGFPFYFGMLTLTLGVLVFGSDYGWGTVKTELMQQPGRLRLLLAKVGALGLMLLLFTVVVLLVGAGTSVVVALREDAAISWPPLMDFVRAIGAGWLLLAVWALFGGLLATISRGTGLAIGFGILYGLVVEGFITGFGTSIPLLQDLAQGFLRTNGYSLIAPLSRSVEEAGPGAFSGPFVDPWQAGLILVGYLLVFGAATGLLLSRRDIT